jgi:hypothetical protein
VQRAVGQVVVLVAVELVVVPDTVVGGQQKTARAAGRIRYPLAGGCLIFTIVNSSYNV